MLMLSSWPGLGDPFDPREYIEESRHDQVTLAGSQSRRKMPTISFPIARRICWAARVAT